MKTFYEISQFDIYIVLFLGVVCFSILYILLKYITHTHYWEKKIQIQGEGGSEMCHISMIDPLYSPIEIYSKSHRDTQEVSMWEFF